jgi:Leucine-rich repeat (LRR) protein
MYENTHFIYDEKQTDSNMICDYITQNYENSEFNFENNNMWSYIFSHYSLPTIRNFSGKIKNIPKEIGQFTNLQYIYLCYNKIKNISKEIGKLTKLRHLYLSYNEIKNVPDEIGELTELEELNLSHNKIKNIPDGIKLLTNLKMLNLHNNEIETELLTCVLNKMNINSL